MNNTKVLETPNRGNKKKSSRWLVVMLILLVLAAAGYFVYINAAVGWLTTNVTVESVEVTEGAIEVIGEVDGWAGVKDVRCTTDEDTVTIYVTAAWPVLYNDSQFAIILDGEYSDIIEINVSDDRNALVIWSAD